MQVLSMTPEQINMLGPNERASIIQLVSPISMILKEVTILTHKTQRATLGVPS